MDKLIGVPICLRFRRWPRGVTAAPCLRAFVLLAIPCKEHPGRPSNGRLTALRIRKRSFSDSVRLTHPCQHEAGHLPCTRPPDFVLSRSSFTIFATVPKDSRLAGCSKCEGNCTQLLPSAFRSALALKDLRSAASNRSGTVFAVFQQLCLLDCVPCTTTDVMFASLLAISIGGLQQFPRSAHPVRQAFFSCVL